MNTDPEPRYYDTMLYVVYEYDVPVPGPYLHPRDQIMLADPSRKNEKSENKKQVKVRSTKSKKRLLECDIFKSNQSRKSEDF